MNIKDIILNHGVIAFPTETVMGLGVAFNDYEAYLRLNSIKRRSEDKPYTMMLYKTSDIKNYAEVNEKIQKVIDAFMPGSLTILLKSKECVPGYVTHNTGIIGIRIPSNKEALDLLKEIDIPLLVPSANRANETPCKSSSEVKAIFKDELDYILEGKCQSGLPSTIVSFKDLANPILIREGSISFKDILNIYNG